MIKHLILKHVIFLYKEQKNLITTTLKPSNASVCFELRNEYDNYLSDYNENWHFTSLKSAIRTATSLFKYS